MTSRRNSSEDDWSLVSDEEDVLSDISYDEVEAEPEVTGTKLETPAVWNDTTTIDEETAAVLSLLPTRTSGRSFAGYSREIRVSLLSPAHQEWFVGPPPHYSSSSSTSSFGKEHVKVAFSGPDIRRRSFPDRLRVATASARLASVDVEPPTFSEVTSFKQDQATQTNLDNAPGLHATHTALFQSALDRSMTMANEHYRKAQEFERISLRVAELEGIIYQSKKKSKRYEMKITFNERSLALAKQRAILSMEYQDNLKLIADDLRRENAQLGAKNAALRGDDEALATRSLDELEDLEDMLVRGMDRVRSVLRSKYRGS